MRLSAPTAPCYPVTGYTTPLMGAVGVQNSGCGVRWIAQRIYLWLSLKCPCRLMRSYDMPASNGQQGLYPLHAANQPTIGHLFLTAEILVLA